MINQFIQRCVSAIGIMLLLAALAVIQSSIVVILFMCLLLVVCAFKEIPLISQSVIERVGMTVLLGLGFLFVGLWYSSVSSRWKIVYCIGCASINDTAAYIGGSIFGRHRFFPTISPNKTWQGVVSSSIVILVVHYAYACYGSYPQWWWHALSVNILATLGDLVESFLKRRAGIKDTGSLLPGHGGILDRIDSIIPLIYWRAILQIMQYFE